MTVGPALSEADHRRHLRRAVLASTVGTAIEWYDFFLYSTVTGLVFAPLYFPHHDPMVGTLEAFGIYAVGFVARPIGAAIFGHYGDRLGLQVGADRNAPADGHATLSRRASCRRMSRSGSGERCC